SLLPSNETLPVLSLPGFSGSAGHLGSDFPSSTTLRVGSGVVALTQRPFNKSGVAPVEVGIAVDEVTPSVGVAGGVEAAEGLEVGVADDAAGDFEGDRSAVAACGGGTGSSIRCSHEAFATRTSTAHTRPRIDMGSALSDPVVSAKFGRAEPTLCLPSDLTAAL